MLNTLKRSFIHSNQITRDSYIWNTLSALFFAIQSAIILIAITHTNGLADAGVFSIAYAAGSLMYYVGEYGVRKYQVSDVKEKLSFTDYHSHRVVACAIAVIASVIYVAYGYFIQGHPISKTIVIFEICLIKVIEAYSEVYFARFQQVGRLDVAAKTNFFRTFVGMAACMLALIVTHNLIISVTIWLVSVLIAMFCSSILVYKEFGTLTHEYNSKHIIKIFSDCAPLFAGYFLLLYISNAPKYAIDACMTDLDQACYNFIFMPVFAVGMLANFIFNPVLVRLAHNWEEKRVREFISIVVKQIAIITGIMLMAVIVAMTIGIPILEIMYNADLTSFKIDLAILMIGGGALALVNFFAVIVTVLRCQKNLIAGYTVTAVTALFLSNSIVESYGIRGASLLYTFLMSILAILFAAITFIMVKKLS